jgi:uncharacterized membrane protein
MRPFARHVIRGLATLLPPLLTVIVFVWMARTIDFYLLRPIHSALVGAIAEAVADIRTFPPPTHGAVGTRPLEAERYTLVGGEQYVPVEVARTAREYLRGDSLPHSAKQVYRIYVEARWLRPAWFVPASLAVLVALVYVAGRIGNRGLLRYLRWQLEQLFSRMPFVSRVYAAIRQVTQQIFSAPRKDVSRVVAVEYPRPGAWCVAYVINEGLAQVADAAGETVLTLFFDTSPVPLSGYTIMVKKSDTIPLDMSLDEAVQYVMSGGIIVPARQAASAAATR